MYFAALLTLRDVVVSFDAKECTVFNIARTHSRFGTRGGHSLVARHSSKDSLRSACLGRVQCDSFRGTVHRCFDLRGMIVRQHFERLI